jgi:hypothetical protein
MRKGCSKVGTVDISLARALWKEKAVASGTEYIYSIISGQIRKTNGKDRLSLTKNMWAASKRGRSIFLVHGVHAAIRDNVSNCKKRKMQPKLQVRQTAGHTGLSLAGVIESTYRA